VTTNDTEVRNAFLSGATSINPQGRYRYQNMLGDEFDAWLASVKAEAWDDGWDAAYKMARSWGHVDWWEEWPTNPYRTED
jgi:hypothetical protein